MGNKELAAIMDGIEKQRSASKAETNKSVDKSEKTDDIKEDMSEKTSATKTEIKVSELEEKSRKNWKNIIQQAVKLNTIQENKDEHEKNAEKQDLDTNALQDCKITLSPETENHPSKTTAMYNSVDRESDIYGEFTSNSNQTVIEKQPKPKPKPSPAKPARKSYLQPALNEPKSTEVSKQESLNPSPFRKYINPELNQNETQEKMALCIAALVQKSKIPKNSNDNKDISGPSDKVSKGSEMPTFRDKSDNTNDDNVYDNVSINTEKVNDCKNQENIKKECSKNKLETELNKEKNDLKSWLHKQNNEGKSTSVSHKPKITIDEANKTKTVPAAPTLHIKPQDTESNTDCDKGSERKAKDSKISKINTEMQNKPKINNKEKNTEQNGDSTKMVENEIYGEVQNLTKKSPDQCINTESEKRKEAASKEKRKSRISFMVENQLYGDIQIDEGPQSEGQGIYDVPCDVKQFTSKSTGGTTSQSTEHKGQLEESIYAQPSKTSKGKITDKIEKQRETPEDIYSQPNKKAPVSKSIEKKPKAEDIYSQPNKPNTVSKGTDKKEDIYSQPKKGVNNKNIKSSTVQDIYAQPIKGSNKKGERNEVSVDNDIYESASLPADKKETEIYSEPNKLLKKSNKSNGSYENVSLPNAVKMNTDNDENIYDNV